MLEPEFLEQLFASFNNRSLYGLNFTLDATERSHQSHFCCGVSARSLMAIIEAAASEYQVNDLRVAAVAPIKFITRLFYLES